MESKHTTKVKGVNLDNNELAEKIGDLYYDSLSEFLIALSEKLNKDSLADRNRGRTQLASELQAGANQIAQAGRSIAEAWNICEPHVKQREAERV